MRIKLKRTWRSALFPRNKLRHSQHRKAKLKRMNMFSELAFWVLQLGAAMRVHFLFLRNTDFDEIFVVVQDYF